MKIRSLFLCFLYVGISPLIFASVAPDDSLESRSEKPKYRIPRVPDHIILDGILDEPLWQAALRIEGNIEVSPGENIPAPVQTEAFLAYNDSYVFVAIKAYDPDPSQIRAHLCDRDNIWDDDWVLILFDTFNDQRRTYDFFCNPFGIQADQIETTTGGGGEWDTIWDSAGRITDEGYVVEMAIPFRSLGFPRSDVDQIWGFDLVRSYPRSVRHHIGAFPRDRNNNCYMCQAPKLVGFVGATPGRNLEFDPTLSGIVSQERKDETSGPFVTREKKADPGITARWGFTPNLALSGTINPDFSNIEADILQLDINNQFAIWYPEKRPFFLEGADFFSTPFSLVHTRTLADPDWGVKVTGKEGANAIGFFTVQDHLTNFLFPGAEGSDSESLSKRSTGSALRYRRDIGKSSNLGVIVTDREGDAYYNRLAGVDGDFKFTQKDRLQFQAAQSQTRYPDQIVQDYGQLASDFNGGAYSLFYTHDTRNWEIYTLQRRVDQDFRADLGFMSQSGFTYSETGGSVKLQRDGGWFTWLSLYSSFDYKRDRFNNPLHKAVTARFNYEGPMQSHVSIYAEHGKNMFEGEHFRANWIQGCTGLRPIGNVWMHVYMRYGDQIDYANCRLGNSFSVSPETDLKLGLHLSISAGYTYERLDVDAGRLYDANIGRLKLIYQFSKRLFVRTIFQYRYYKRNVDLYEDDDVDPETKGLFTQALVSYKINPQTVFFLGYSDNYYGDHETAMIQTNRTVFAKIGYAYTL